MPSRYEIAQARRLKAEAEELAEFMDEFTLPDTPVYDETGRLMSKEEIVERTRNSWKDEARERGLPIFGI